MSMMRGLPSFVGYGPMIRMWIVYHANTIQVIGA